MLRAKNEFYPWKAGTARFPQCSSAGSYEKFIKKPRSICSAFMYRTETRGRQAVINSMHLFQIKAPPSLSFSSWLDGGDKYSCHQKRTGVTWIQDTFISEGDSGLPSVPESALRFGRGAGGRGASSTPPPEHSLGNVLQLMFSVCSCRQISAFLETFHLAQGW